VSQFEIFSGCWAPTFSLRFPERRPLARPLFCRAMPLHADPPRPVSGIPGHVDVAVHLHLAMRASQGYGSTAPSAACGRIPNSRAFPCVRPRKDALVDTAACPTLRRALRGRDDGTSIFGAAGTMLFGTFGGEGGGGLNCGPPTRLLGDCALAAAAKTSRQTRTAQKRRSPHDEYVAIAPVMCKLD
jgi:hypothetical protein